MAARASLRSDQFSADQLRLSVSPTLDRRLFDLEAYEEFIDGISNGREYQAQSIRTVLRYYLGGRYADASQLARESYEDSPDLKRLYPSVEALVRRLPFSDKLACTLDLATGTGKSWVMYAVARIMLNEGVIDRVLVLAPSLTIESGLIEKFNLLTADGDLSDMMPVRGHGHRVPTIVNANATVQVGEICVENVHAAYERTGTSLRDSFAGVGSRALVISDEAHHLISVAKNESKRWHAFIADPSLGFRFHLGVSGTCYAADNSYFTDVVYRYSIRDAINDNWVKEVFYLAEDASTTDDDRFQKLLTQHEKNRISYRPLKPLTIAVAKDIKGAETLRTQLVEFLSSQSGQTRDSAEKRVLIVTSSPDHSDNLIRLKTVDESTDPTEWVVSVSMLTEGWDVKNVFQIYPHEKRAFNSKLLISQVLGRGLRRPEGPSAPSRPRVYVFNHQKWGPQIDDYVAEILDTHSTISQRPASRKTAEHFFLHQLRLADVPTEVQVRQLEGTKQLTSLNLRPQIDTTEQTKFVSATDPTKASLLVTRVVDRRYDTDDVVLEVRSRLVDHQRRRGGVLADEYPKLRIHNLITEALSRLGLDGKEVSQENRQIVLRSFCGLRQQSVVPHAMLEVKPIGIETLSTADMRSVSVRVMRLRDSSTLFWDEYSAELGTEEDSAALKKAEDLYNTQIGVGFVEVLNSFDFKSPVNVILADHTPERRFIQRLLHPTNSGALRSWVKAPDSGFFEIEYSFQEGGAGRSRRGRFNPDFFMLLNAANIVVVTEVKADDDNSWRNKGKADAARQYFRDLNAQLEDAGEDRRYAFHMLTPQDFESFLEVLRDGDIANYVSTLQGQLDAMS